MTAPMLSRVSVTGLFGSKTLEFDLETTMPTVLTGRNGSGKSTILGLLNNVATGNIHELFTAPINSLDLFFANDSKFSWERECSTRARIEWRGQSHLLDYPATALHPSTIRSWPSWARRMFDSTDANFVAFRHLLLNSPKPPGVPPLSWRTLRQDLLEDSAAMFPELPEWIANIDQEFRTVFITDQRLVMEEGDADTYVNPARYSKPIPAERAVERAAKDIAQKIRLSDSRYSRRSQEIDRTFARQLIDRLRQQPVERDLHKRIAATRESVSKERERLYRVGLLDSPDEMDADTDSGSPLVQEVTLAFLESTQRKLQTLDSLATRLTRLKDFVDVRYAPKFLKFDNENGVLVELSSGEMLNARQLSSGEQQVFMMAYEVFFKAPKGTLILMDEPEISLHLSWQESLLRDLANRGEKFELQFLVATHSPVISSEFPEGERFLDGLTRD